jgi:hypothetical protein
MMRYDFDHDLTIDGVPIAPISGEARIIEKTGAPGYWQIASIRIDASSGPMRRVEVHSESPSVRAREVFRELALWLYHVKRDDIDAEWQDHCSRQAHKLAGAA